MEVRRSSRASKRVLVEEEPEIDDEEEVVASARSRRDKPARNERAKSTKASSAVARTAAPPKESSALAAFGFKLEKGQSQVDTLKPKSPAAKKAAASCVDDDDDNEGLSDEAEFDDGASSDGDSEDFANDSSAAGQGNGAMDESESDAEAVAKEVDWVVGDHVEVLDDGEWLPATVAAVTAQGLRVRYTQDSSVVTLPSSSVADSVRKPTSAKEAAADTAANASNKRSRRSAAKKDAAAAAAESAPSAKSGGSSGRSRRGDSKKAARRQAAAPARKKTKKSGRRSQKKGGCVSYAEVGSSGEDSDDDDSDEASASEEKVAKANKAAAARAARAGRNRGDAAAAAAADGDDDLVAAAAPTDDVVTTAAAAAPTAELTESERAALAAEGWTFTHPLVGSATRRLFREGACADGVLVAFLSADGEDPPMWKNKHGDDGELEDLEAHEVKQAALNHRLRLESPRGGYFAEDFEASCLLSGDDAVIATGGIGNIPSSASLAAAHKTARGALGVVALLPAQAQELKAEGWVTMDSPKASWYPALARLLGKNTRRFFRSSVIKGGGPTDGTVVGFLPPEADGPPLFKNLHGADGELEDLEIHELRLALASFHAQALSPSPDATKGVACDGREGFFEAQFGDDDDDEDYDGNPEEEDAARAKAEDEDLAHMPACFVGQECLTLQAVVASHSATARGWCRLMAQAAPSSRVGTDGSAFTKRIYGPTDDAEYENKENVNPTVEGMETESETAAAPLGAAASPTAAQLSKLDNKVPLKRYLCKWRDVSHLHVSWETAAALKLVLGSQRATQALSTFTTKDGEDGFLNDFGLHLDLEYADCDLDADDTSSPSGTSGDAAAGADGGGEDGEGLGVDKKTSSLPAGGRWFTNALYVTPERVLAADPPLASSSLSSLSAEEHTAATARKEEQLVRVKWCGLPYGCATWEKLSEVPNGTMAFDAFRQRAVNRQESPSASSGSGNASEGGSIEKRSRKGKKNKSLDEAALEASLPATLAHGGQLRDYQRQGVTWMLFNWHRSRSSLLADEMGLGKTIQTVAYCSELHEKYSVRGPFLIVAPLSTLPHWQREFQRWSNLDAVVYAGDSEDREAFRRYEMGPKTSNGRAGSHLQVVITSFEQVSNSDAHYLRAVPWSVLVVDEAHRLKNATSKAATSLRNFDFDRSLLLTGTPLQNNLAEFWALLNFMDPATFGDEAAFSAKFGDLRTSEQLDQLTAETRRYMLRRMKEDVEKSVPPKEETHVSVELTGLQRTYYRALYEKNLAVLHPRGKKACDGPSLMNVAMELRKCCNHPFLLRGVRDQVLGALPKVPDASTLEACGGSLIKAKASAEVDALVKCSGKLVFLDKLLPKLQAEGHRVLIFSQFKIMLDLLEDFLRGRSFGYERLDGDIVGAARQAAIDRYQRPTSTSLVMLLSTKAGGCGINLVAADTVVIFDSDFNPQNDLQAQARCHRIGQTKAVHVYRLLCARTYEMKMSERASHKLALDRAVLGSQQQGLAPLSKKEVEELLKRGAVDFFGADATAAAEREKAAEHFATASIDELLDKNTALVVTEGGKSGKNKAKNGSGSPGKSSGSNVFAAAAFEPADGQNDGMEQESDKDEDDDDDEMASGDRRRGRGKGKGYGRGKKQSNGAAGGDGEEVDLGASDFWERLGLVNEDAPLDIDDLDQLADGMASKKNRRRRAGTRQNVSYKDDGVPIIIGAETSSESDADDDDEDDDDDEKDATAAAAKAKEWTSKELKALFNAILSRGALVERPSGGPQALAAAVGKAEVEVFAAAPGNSTKAARNEKVGAGAGIATAATVTAEPTEMKDDAEATPEPALSENANATEPSSAASAIPTEEVAVAAAGEVEKVTPIEEEAKDAAPVPTRWNAGEVQEMSCWLLFKHLHVLSAHAKAPAVSAAAGAAGAKDEPPQASTSSLRSLLGEHKWARSVYQALCAAIDQRNNALLASSSTTTGASGNDAENNAPLPLLDDQKQGVGPLESQLLPLLAKIEAEESAAEAQAVATAVSAAKIPPAVKAIATAAAAVAPETSTVAPTEGAPTESTAKELTAESESSAAEPARAESVEKESVAPQMEEAPVAAEEAADTITADALSAILLRYAPRVLASSSSGAGKLASVLSENAARKAVKATAELWTVAELVASVEAADAASSTTVEVNNDTDVAPGESSGSQVRATGAMAATDAAAPAPSSSSQAPQESQQLKLKVSKLPLAAVCANAKGALPVPGWSSCHDAAVLRAVAMHGALLPTTNTPPPAANCTTTTCGAGGEGDNVVVKAAAVVESDALAEVTAYDAALRNLEAVGWPPRAPASKPAKAAAKQHAKKTAATTTAGEEEATEEGAQDEKGEEMDTCREETAAEEQAPESKDNKEEEEVVVSAAMIDDEKETEPQPKPEVDPVASTTETCASETDAAAAAAAAVPAADIQTEVQAPVVEAASAPSLPPPPLPKRDVLARRVAALVRATKGLAVFLAVEQAKHEAKQRAKASAEAAKASAKLAKLQAAAARAEAAAAAKEAKALAKAEAQAEKEAKAAAKKKPKYAGNGGVPSWALSIKSAFNKAATSPSSSPSSSSVEAGSSGDAASSADAPAAATADQAASVAEDVSTAETSATSAAEISPSSPSLAAATADESGVKRPAPSVGDDTAATAGTLPADASNKVSKVATTSSVNSFFSKGTKPAPTATTAAPAPAALRLSTSPSSKSLNVCATPVPAAAMAVTAAPAGDLAPLETPAASSTTASSSCSSSSSKNAEESTNQSPTSCAATPATSKGSNLAASAFTPAATLKTPGGEDLLTAEKVDKAATSASAESSSSSLLSSASPSLASAADAIASPTAAADSGMKRPAPSEGGKDVLPKGGKAAKSTKSTSKDKGGKGKKAVAAAAMLPARAITSFFGIKPVSNKAMATNVAAAVVEEKEAPGVATEAATLVIDEGN